MEKINCIFCNIENDGVIIEENGYKGRKCSQCGLIYISPRPSFDEITDLYGHDNAGISAAAHISADFQRRLYARHNLRILRSFIHRGSLLEIGSGAGFFLDEARRVGFSPYGLEFNPIQAAFIRDELKIPCEEAALNTPVFAGKKFDVVYHCDVISHFFNPIEEFKKINEIMNDEAYMMFETGNFGEVNPVYFRGIQRFQYPDHLFFFSTDNLINLLDRTGFDTLKIYRYSFMPQLMLIRIISKIRHLFLTLTGRQKSSNSPAAGCGKTAGSPYAGKSSRRFSVKTVIRKTLDYLNYLFRYKIGYLVPKKHRPQTVIIVARKRKSGIPNS